MPLWLMIMFQAMTALPGLITSAEQAFRGSGTGPQKKQVVLDSVRTGLDVASRFVTDLDPLKKDAIVTAAGDLTDAVVGAMNAVEAFRHHTTPQA